MGPIFVRHDGGRGELQIARFRFNAWAKYPDWKQDDQVPDRAAQGAAAQDPARRAQRAQGGPRRRAPST